MPSADPVPAIAEADATGEIAELYADIRGTLGMPLVNLIWRSLAAIPGGLAWAWPAVKPLYANGRIQGEASALRKNQRLPAMRPMPVAALRAVGVDAKAEETIRGILESYDRGNPLNIIALSALLAILRDEVSADSRRKASISVADDLPLSVKLPPLLPLDGIPDDTMSLIRAVNRIGARGRDHIIVSMPRHMAHWPGFLSLYWAILTPVDASGALSRCIDAVVADGQLRGMRLAGTLAKNTQSPPPSRDAIVDTLDDFVRNAISRMIPVVSLLKLAMPVDGEASG
jgi:hypothetical protein